MELSSKVSLESWGPASRLAPRANSLSNHEGGRDRGPLSSTLSNVRQILSYCPRLPYPPSLKYPEDGCLEGCSRAALHHFVAAEANPGPMYKSDHNGYWAALERSKLVRLGVRNRSQSITTPGDFLQVKLSKTVTFLPRSTERIGEPFPATAGFSFGATQQTEALRISP